MRSVFYSLMLLLFNASPYAQSLDQFRILNHLDNYGNLDLRNKPYTDLPAGLVIKGNLNIAKTQIKSLPQELDVQGSLNASNSGLARISKGVNWT